MRALIGDTDWEPLIPVEPGVGNYAVYSDDTLEAYLLEGGSTLRAAALAITRLALEYAQSDKSIRTDDLSLDISRRGSTLLEVAKSFRDDADAEDAARFAEVFTIAPFGGRRGLRGGF